MSCANQRRCAGVISVFLGSTKRKIEPCGLAKPWPFGKEWLLRNEDAWKYPSTSPWGGRNPFGSPGKPPGPVGKPGGKAVGGPVPFGKPPRLGVPCSTRSR